MASTKSQWTQAAFEREVEAILARAQAPTDRAEELSLRLQQDSLAKSSADRLRTLALAFVVLRDEMRDRSMTAAQIDELTRAGEMLLKVEGIEAGTSQLSHLHGELAGFRTLALVARGAYPEAAWTAFEADRLAMRSTDEHEEAKRLLLMAKQTLRLGQTRLTIELLSVVASGPTGALRDEAMALTFDALRLSGDREAAGRFAHSYGDNPSIGAATRSHLEWGQALLDFIAQESADHLMHVTAREGRFYGASQLVDVSLLFKACKSRAWIGSTLKPKTIKRAFPAETAAVKRDLHFACQCLEALDDAYDATLPLDSRLTALKTAFLARDTFANLERELLLLAALGRCLARLRQDGFAALVIGEYRKLSLTASTGASQDVLGLMTDLLDRSWYRTVDAGEVESVTPELVATMPTGRLSRSARVGKMSAQIAGTIIASRLRKVLATKAEKARLAEAEAERIGRILASNLGALRGAVMKLGQLLSVSHAVLPAAVRDILVSVQTKAPPMPYPEMKAVFVAEFGKTPEESFAVWNPVPIASASIGQVYRARTFDGREVCVKIQYPNIEQTIKDDIANMSLALPFVRFFGRHTDFAAVLNELKDMLVSECDYRAEAANTQHIAGLVADDPVLVVARVVPESSGARVLTTEYIDGMSFRDFVASAPLAERQAAANALFSAGLLGFMDHGLLNVDTNPGNFLFKDGKVHCIDFGCVRVWDDKFRLGWINILAAFYAGDIDAVGRYLTEVGYIADPDNFDIKWELETSRLLIDRPASHKMDLAAIREYLDRVILNHRNAQSVRIDPKMLSLYRAVWGLLGLAVELDVADEWRDLLLQRLAAKKQLPRAG